ncbi:Dihydroorotate dehydrogenase B (NAD(+)), catalytic subunit [Poriferisphaera corsica]|uniref:Dihydroorotate dehydrogenase B (NAD(+)), catalytic subunit n=1 Tax=Poriferisphaera corsica TaxID=2528020 RepID=A0A517YUG0_9BACT|nr:hypothetical protein [Poriferisphaera corsica]QDU33822.1 Dihydroorotate dehydrogenase B (NAD(+)), catalytic subunit [Poriferisphaera corsica]
MENQERKRDVLRAGLKPVVISAPFGNYIQPSGTTATLGTYTAKARGGRVMQIIKTVRYYPRIKGWVNKIGLRNPGIDWLKMRVDSGKIDASDKLLSIHGFDDGEWYELLEKVEAIKPLAVELNMSCPNVGHINWPKDLFKRAVATGVPVVAKIPPVNYEQMIKDANADGVEAFHCCNTLPNVAGGISGKPLKPVAIQCIRDMRSQKEFRDALIIGGGGIYQNADVDDFLTAGADVVALGTKTMNPMLLISHGSVQPLIRYAEKAVNG